MTKPARAGWLECGLVGLGVFGLIGTGALMAALGGVIVFLRSDTSFAGFLRETDPSVVALAGVAAALTGAIAWRRIVARRSRPGRGALAGAITGIAAHPVFWLLTCLYGAVTFPHGEGHFLLGIPLVVTLGTFSSLGMLGWISVPLAGLLGALAALTKGWLVRPEDGRPGPDREGAPG